MPQLAVTVVPGAIVMAPVVPLMQTSPLYLPGIGLAEPVVSAVTAPENVSSVFVLEAGHFVPVPVVGIPKVVVFPLFQVTVPPPAKLAIGIALDFVPVLPLHFLSLTELATLPLTLVQVIVDFAEAPAGPAERADSAADRQSERGGRRDREPSNT